MTKLKVLMVDLQSYYLSSPYQYGLLIAYANLEPEVRENIDFEISTHSREATPKEIVNELLARKPEMIAISNYAWNYRKICGVLDLLSQQGAVVPRILLGGPNSAGSFGADMLRRYPIISAIVDGEGEPAFRDICVALADSPSRDPFTGSSNCVVRDAGGGLTRPDVLKRITSLDDIPSPYITGLLKTHPSPVFFETNRGCPYRCTYCYWGNGNSKIHRMSLDRVREEVEFFAAKKVSSFWLADANFGVFRDDAKIAEMMSSINARNGFPFRHVGVNWAKNSSDKIIDIASLFKQGNIGCTTTIALQSVTPQAEENTKRYSMPPSKFSSLINNAESRDLDTYTDIIWGLPGETLDQYLHGLDAVISTGVPSIKIHQLYLLPGTEMYEQRQEFDICMAEDKPDSRSEDRAGSEFANYIVVSHSHMSADDMKCGSRVIGINQLLHNHNLGRATNLYLSRYGLSSKQIYQFFDEVVRGTVNGFESGAYEFLDDIRDLILQFSAYTGSDESLFYRHLSDAVWYRKGSGKITFRLSQVESFMLEFYRVLIKAFQPSAQDWELKVLSEFVKYNMLIAPKPAWSPQAEYDFEYDIAAIYTKICAEIYSGSGSEQQAVLASTGENARRVRSATDNAEDRWQSKAGLVRGKLKALLSDNFMEENRRRVAYKVSNPWRIPPSKTSLDWLMSNRSKHCQVHPL